MTISLIGASIAKVREALGLTQSALARRCGTSQSAIAMIEAGDRNPSFDMLLKIKRALGVEWVGLLREIE